MLALVSVSDKRGLVPFGQGLKDLGFKILSTGGTLDALKQAGVTATKVSELGEANWQRIDRALLAPNRHMFTSRTSPSPEVRV